MRKLIQALVNLVRGFFYEAPQEIIDLKPISPAALFPEVLEVEKIPDSDAVSNNQFFAVVYKKKLYWTVFCCPCGCGELISLPMSEPHSPRWRLRLSKNMRPSLSPSVWRNRGCMSHFWIEDGRVNMCGNTGTPPWIARPEIYSKPLR